MKNMVLPAQLRRSAESTYAVVALFTLTQGPVYRLWSESATYLTTSPQPSIPHIYFATFVAVQLPALLMFCRHVPDSFFRSTQARLLVALMGWLGISVLWSMLARYSLPEFVALLLTTSFGMYLVTRFSLAQMWRITSLAMTIGLLVSLVAIQRNWDAAVSEEYGYWIGIYYNRNSLAPVAAVALLAAVGNLLNINRKNTVDVIVVVGSVLSMALAIVVLWRAESRTSPFALIVAMAAALLWWILRWGFGRLKRLSSLLKYSAALAVAVSAIAVFIAVRLVGGLGSVSGETATFNSRGVLWSVSWSGFLLKPFHGWGWMAAWHTPNFRRQGEWWMLWDTNWSHNGYHDLLLGGGVLSLLLFIGVIFWSVLTLDRQPKMSTALPRLLVIGFVLTAATQESFFIGSHFLWALLIAALFAGETVSQTSVKQ